MARFLEIVGKTNIDFMGKRYYTFAFSGILTLLGLISIFQIGRGTANMGIDFAGGTAVQLKFEDQVRIEEARQALGKHGLGDAELQEFAQDNKLLVRVKKQTAIQEKVADQIVQVFSREFPQKRFVVDSSTEIGPTIGKKLQRDAVTAITFAMLGIIFYIAIRFEFRFGVAAAIATMHNGALQTRWIGWVLDGISSD